jgi:hypothetical protein
MINSPYLSDVHAKFCSGPLLFVVIFIPRGRIVPGQAGQSGQCQGYRTENGRQHHPSSIHVSLHRSGESRADAFPSDFYLSMTQVG